LTYVNSSVDLVEMFFIRNAKHPTPTTTTDHTTSDSFVIVLGRQLEHDNAIATVHGPALKHSKWGLSITSSVSSYTSKWV